MRVSSNENCAQWRWATAPALLPAGAGWVVGMVWEYGWQEKEQEGRGEHTDESGACSQSGSQADEPSRLRGSRRARTRPAQRRGRWGEEVGLSPIGAWPWTMKSLIIDGPLTDTRVLTAGVSEVVSALGRRSLSSAGSAAHELPRSGFGGLGFMGRPTTSTVGISLCAACSDSVLIDSPCQCHRCTRRGSKAPCATRAPRISSIFHPGCENLPHESLTHGMHCLKWK